MRYLTTFRRHLLLLAVLLATTACNPPEKLASAEPFIIETEQLRIRVEGDRAAFERSAGQILTRIDTVDPALIRPGIGLWAEPEDTAPHLPGRPKLVLVGRVVAVEPRAGGY